MTTASHDFGKPLPKYRAESAVNKRLRKPTFEEEMIDNAVRCTLKAWNLIDPKIIEKAAIEYLTPGFAKAFFKANR